MRPNSPLLPLATRRTRRRLAAAGAVAVTAAALISGAAPASATAVSALTWRAVKVPVSNGVLNDLSALGPSDAWAVGSDFLSTSIFIVLRWNGRAWSQGPTTGIPAGVALGGVDALSNRDVLADGNLTNLTDVVYRFNGSRWTSLPRPKAAEGGLAPYSASFGPGGQIWAFGWMKGDHPAFWKLTASGWRTYVTGVNARGYLSDPVFVTPDDAWSDGFTFTASAATPVLLHFNGRAWSRVAAPPLPRTEVTAELNGLLATRGGQLWVSGNWQACPLGKTCPNVPFVSRRSGSRWTNERLPAQVKTVSGLSPDQSGQPQWMTVTTADMSAPYFVHYSRGSWALVRGAAIAGGSNPSVEVVHVPGTNATWAVGWAQTGSAAFTDPIMELNGKLP